jgi:hypothetical protein
MRILARHDLTEVIAHKNARESRSCIAAYFMLCRPEAEERRNATGFLETGSLNRYRITGNKYFDSVKGF